MNVEWSLKELYKGFEDPAYEADFAALETAIKREKELVKKAESMELKDAVEQILLAQEESVRLLYNLNMFIDLSGAVDTEDGAIMAQGNRIMKQWSSRTAVETAAKKIFAKIPDVDAMGAGSELIREYSFLINQVNKSAQ